MRSALALVIFVTLACGSAGPQPVAGSPQSVPQLQFAVMDSVGKPVWCDPDFYPIARAGGEEANAMAKYPEIKQDAAVYAAIAAHDHLPTGELNDAQKLTLYRAWKLLGAVRLVPNGSGYSFEYTVQSTTAGYEKVTGTVRVDGAVSVDSRIVTRAPNCPICLAASTMIATPDGPVRVTDVSIGTVVWTEDARGGRIAAPVVALGSVPVAPGHMMVHLVLADGREVLASPGHRTGEGRPLASLKPGDPVDGSSVLRWELLAYSGSRTYDLLPGGTTGRYWANGIVLASTLA